MVITWRCHSPMSCSLPSFANDQIISSVQWSSQAIHVLQYWIRGYSETCLYPWANSNREVDEKRCRFFFHLEIGCGSYHSDKLPTYMYLIISTQKITRLYIHVYLPQFGNASNKIKYIYLGMSLASISSGSEHAKKPCSK